MIWSEKQRENLHNATRRWNFKDGATRSGKTYLDLFIIPKRIKRVRGLPGLVVILGNTKGTLQRNIIEGLQGIWGTKYVSDIKSDNTAMLFGERCYCLGADKVSQVDRLRGSSIKYCYGDEVATWHPDVFTMLKSRLDKPYSKFDGTLNPESPTHWLYPFLYERNDLDIYHQVYQLTDNPYIDPSVVESLKKEYAGTVYYDRYILGKWVRAEGLIYDTFNENKIINTQGMSFDYKWVACDYGTQNATVFLLLGMKNSSLYVIKEYYYSGRDTNKQKTDSDYAKDMREFILGHRIEDIVVDPSAASFIAELSDRGFPVSKADNGVLDGIRRVSSRFALGRLFIDPACSNLIRELNSYSWDDKSKEEKPLKEDDHAVDALRYGVAYSDSLGYVRY